MRESVVDRVKRIVRNDAPEDPFLDRSTQNTGPELPPTPKELATLKAYEEYLQNQTKELLTTARFLHARILLAIQANEMDSQLCKILYDGFLNMAALVQVKE